MKENANNIQHFDHSQMSLEQAMMTLQGMADHRFTSEESESGTLDRIRTTE